MGEGAVLPEGRQCMRSCLNGGGGGGEGQSAYDGGGGGGGGAVHFWHTENTLSLIIHGFANRYSITERA